MATALEEPSDRNPVAHLQGGNTRSNLAYAANTFVTDNRAWLFSKVAGCDVQVSVAKATVFNVNEGFTRLEVATGGCVG